MFRISTMLIFLSLFLVFGCSPPDDNNDMGEDASTDGGGEVDFDPEEFGWLLHVQGRNAEDVYVLGGEPTAGRMKRFNGEVWQDEMLPSGTPLLNWIQLWDGVATAVGSGGTVLRNDGTGWVSETTPTEEDLWGVWGASPDDVWAVGGRGRAEGQATVLRRVDGVWTEVAPPELVRPGVNAWFKVWGTSADNFYVVGQRGGVLHWTGTAFEEEGVGSSEDLISLHGTGPDNVMIVGGRSNGVVSRWDGMAWNTQSISPAPGANGVWMMSEDTAWVAGVNGLLRKGTWDAQGVFDLPRLAPASDLDLHAVIGIDGFGLIAVGGNFEQPQGPYRGDVVRLEEF